MSRRSNYPYKDRPLDIPGGIRCLGGVSDPTNTDPRIYQMWDQVSRRSKHPYKHRNWIYQRWDQVPKRSKYPYKHRPIHIPEVGSGV